MSNKMKPKFEYYFICAKCADTKGGVFPQNHCCTVHLADCPYCGNVDTLYAWNDFDYPADKEVTLKARNERD